ncbi:GntR family transcriptional regulator, partial [Paraburkholderia sp. SIMBA_030]|uniref:GntR family transcriptional regulator n=1 Tax=Paraburkholderia sp. SIMBA_030 TaxID=3085773 RepID=UPI00397A4CDE
MNDTTRPSSSRADHVYYSVRDDIFEMRLLPGDRLTEGSIAERFGVSRTPAREALQRLQSDGLMRGYVRGGWEVVPIDLKRFEDLYEMRKLIETFAVGRLVAADTSLSGRMQQTLDRLDAIWKVPHAQRIRDGRARYRDHRSRPHARRFARAARTRGARRDGRTLLTDAGRAVG